MNPSAANSHLQHLLRGTAVQERISASAAPAPRAASYAVADTREAAEALEDVFGPHAGDDDTWDWRSWIRHAGRDGEVIVAVLDGPNGSPQGFASIASSLEMSFEDESEVSLNLEISSIYVLRGSRGRGYGTALRHAAASYITSIIDQIAAIPAGLVADYGAEHLRITLDAVAQSVEGERFCASLCRDIEDHLDAVAGAAWFGNALLDGSVPEHVGSAHP
jgi:GNAT superfamily N-acetyltransferase